MHFAIVNEYNNFNNNHPHCLLIFHRVKIGDFFASVVDSFLAVLNKMKPTITWKIFSFNLHIHYTIYLLFTLNNNHSSSAELPPSKCLSRSEYSPEKQKYSNEMICKKSNFYVMSGLKLNYLIYNVRIFFWILLFHFLFFEEIKLF